MVSIVAALSFVRVFCMGFGALRTACCSVLRRFVLGLKEKAARKRCSLFFFENFELGPVHTPRPPPIGGGRRRSPSLANWVPIWPLGPYSWRLFCPWGPMDRSALSR